MAIPGSYYEVIQVLGSLYDEVEGASFMIMCFRVMKSMGRYIMIILAPMRFIYTRVGMFVKVMRNVGCGDGLCWRIRGKRIFMSM